MSALAAVVGMGLFGQVSPANADFSCNLDPGNVSRADKIFGNFDLQAFWTVNGTSTMYCGALSYSILTTCLHQAAGGQTLHALACAEHAGVGYQSASVSTACPVLTQGSYRMVARGAGAGPFGNGSDAKVGQSVIVTFDCPIRDVG